MNKILESLSQLLKAFCATHGMPFMSADDILAMRPDCMTKEMTQWLNDYVALWDSTQAMIGGNNAQS
jgi:hypothetical protein